MLRSFPILVKLINERLFPLSDSLQFIRIEKPHKNKWKEKNRERKVFHFR